LFKQFIRTAINHLWRNRLYSLINITGLTLGLICTLLAILYVRDEMGYDRFHKNAPQLYRLTTTIVNPLDNSERLVGTTGQVQGPAFKAAIPEISDFVRVFGLIGTNVTSSNKSLAVRTLYADKNFFELFSFPLIHGNAISVLKEPYSMVISESTAMKFFGTADAVGKTLKIEEGHGIEVMTVTGIAKDAPANSSIRFDMVVPFTYLQLMFDDNNWLNQYLTTFILLHPTANPKIVAQKFSNVFQVNAKNQLSESKMNAAEFKFGLVPFTSTHLQPLALEQYGTSDEERGLSDGSTITYSYMLMGIVSFILLMACVNFINLNIAGSLKRAKEISIRKISGSNRRQIVIQFLGEALILFLIAFILAILFCQILLPVFNQLANKKISFSQLFAPELFLYGGAIMCVCVLVAGLYPAIMLSLFNPAEVLYNRQKLNRKNIFGKSLIVLQFTLAVSLIIATIVYYSQIDFISTKELGYNPADIIKIHLPPQRVDKKMISIFRNELLHDQSIKQITSEMGLGSGPVSVDGREFNSTTASIDEYYLPTLRVQLKEGRNFSGIYGTDSTNAVIVNETFVHAAGWDNPIGQKIRLSDEKKLMTVIGVIKDYHFGSLREKIAPELLMMGNVEYILIKIAKGKIPQALSLVEKTHRKIIPDHYYQFEFLDNENAIVYQNDKRWQQIISFATVIAIIICCIGLFGLAYYSTQQRIKEIGVRKVLGASVTNISLLLVRDFLILVIIAIIIASPIAWYSMQNWLQQFAYRISISWWMFGTGGLIALGIASMTVSFQSIKAALANPVKSLRTE
jgi:putative ABC transport system permease protein